MTQVPFHNWESFRRAIERLVQKADQQGRGDDLDRVVNHLNATPREVSNLASVMMLIDEDFRVLLRQEVQAIHRWSAQKDKPIMEDQIVKVMLEVYRSQRGVD